MTRRNLSQREISDLLGGPEAGWSQSRVAKILTGRVELGVEDLAALCFALGLPLVEALRDRGMEFYAEMSPEELRLLQTFRQLPKAALDLITAFIAGYPGLKADRVERRGATKPRDVFGKPRNRPSLSE